MEKLNHFHVLDGDLRGQKALPLASDVFRRPGLPTFEAWFSVHGYSTFKAAMAIAELEAYERLRSEPAVIGVSLPCWSDACQVIALADNEVIRMAASDSTQCDQCGNVRDALHLFQTVGIGTTCSWCEGWEKPETDEETDEDTD